MSANGYIAVFVVAGLLSHGLARFLMAWAKRRNLFMPPVRERDIHQIPVPRVGGIAIVAAFLLVIFGLALFWPSTLHFTDTNFLGFDRNLIGLMVAVIILSLVNIRDDLQGLGWPIRLTVQILCALLIFWFGIRINWLTNPFGGRIIIESIGFVLVTVWLVGLSNVVNWLDGVDGLASSVTAIALAVLFFLSIRPDIHQGPNALLSIAALGAVVGFLPLNLTPARAFLGDTGSVFLGFLIGVLAIISGGKVATAFLVLAIPFLDALFVFIGRILHGRSPFLADKGHLHHRLLRLGLKPGQIVAVFATVSLMFGLIALNTQTLGKIQGAALALLLMVVFLGGYAALLRARKEYIND